MTEARMHTSPVAAASTEQALRDFIAGAITDDMVRRAADQCGMRLDEARTLIEIYSNESLVGLRLIAPLLRPGLRILEVGSGVGLLATFLTRAGYDVVAIEPAATGFAFMSQIADSLATAVGLDEPLRALPLMVQQLEPVQHGTFGLIFSVNVIEHVDPLDEAFRAMTDLLDTDGQMVHLCPNYRTPYEPHFGIPLLPFWPSATRFLFPSVKTRHPGLWDSLNFVTAQRLRGIAAACGLAMTLDERVMSNAVRRLTNDPIYRSRQNALVAGAMTGFAALGGLRMLDALPASWTSPMIARFRKLPANAGS